MWRAARSKQFCQDVSASGGRQNRQEVSDYGCGQTAGKFLVLLTGKTARQLTNLVEVFRFWGRAKPPGSFRIWWRVKPPGNFQFWWRAKPPTVTDFDGGQSARKLPTLVSGSTQQLKPAGSSRFWLQATLLGSFSLWRHAKQPGSVRCLWRATGSHQTRQEASGFGCLGEGARKGSASTAESAQNFLVFVCGQTRKLGGWREVKAQEPHKRKRLARFMKKGLASKAGRGRIKQEV